jgi:EF hand
LSNQSGPINGTGFGIHTGWIQSNDGFLVLDKNGDGNIDSVDDFIGAQNGSGFAALAQYDSNGDGVIDASDLIYAQLKIWRDLNGDGQVGPGELETLAQAGITSIKLASTAQSGDTVAGNTITATGSFVRADGTTGTIADDIAWHEVTLESTDEPVTTGIKMKLPWQPAYRGQMLDGDTLRHFGTKKTLANTLSTADFQYPSDPRQ